MILALWIENVFSHGSGVCHIVYGVWGMVPFGMYLDDDEDISILSELASSEFNGFVINKVFEYLNGLPKKRQEATRSVKKRQEVTRSVKRIL